MIKRSKSSKLFGNILILVFGIIFIVVSLVFIFQYYHAKENFDETEATIIDVNHQNEKIKITYTYDGNNYIDTLNSYWSTANVNDKLIVYINPDNPYSFVDEKSYLGFTIILIFGLSFLIGGTIWLLNIIKFERNIKMCLSEGMRKKLKVISLNSSKVYFNKRPMYYILVQYQNKNYKSELFLLPKQISSMNDAIVDFYFIDDKHYYIDIESYRSKEVEN